jgi:hypothetical protein
LYPLEAFGGAFFVVAAAIRYRFERDWRRLTAFLLYAAVALAAGGLALTIKAAPIMLGIRDLPDPEAVRRLGPRHSAFDPIAS